MRRLVSTALACGLVASSTMGSALHVHEYADHDHPDHHHGPAAHEHSTAAHRDHHSSADDDHGAVIEAESCDPGRHSISLAMGCAYLPQVDVELAEAPGPISEAPGCAIRSAIALTDVRVHGPPFQAAIPSRAPPVTPHA